MKKTIYISLLLLTAVAYVNVSCAAAKVPAATCEVEKAVLPTPVAISANFHGAIVDFTVSTYPAMEMFEPMALAKCVYCVDDNFYRNGYKAKLSKAVKEVIVPPDSKRKIYLTQLKQC